MTTRTNAVRAALERLGATPNAVADFLRERQIKGIRNGARSCPVAHYLQSEFPDFDRIHVNTMSVRVDDANTVSMPDPVRRFIRAFDSYSYGDLRET